MNNKNPVALFSSAVNDEQSKLIEIEVRSVFGNDLIYPINDNAKILAKIAKTKTLSIENIAAAVSLGLIVEEVNPNKLNLVVQK